ncbi:hypothetical protein Aph01nite_71670 [Acrocarpospora phusangensis]|uniref:Uncharacterized protein n=1 Tax=Acrocarpospora phusangensis TaxID=1070424 RepID=A0A919QMH5_9ACTN|nr:hypothetical protein [Acrocarpospora phusangensis]GIH28857.1 hypothetical protein Aph01nite_71670 [Acrocarpospora phusangensis]
MSADRRPVGGPPRPRPAFRLGQTTRYALLVTAVICIAVAVPPLLIPQQDGRAETSAAQEPAQDPAQEPTQEPSKAPETSETPTTQQSTSGEVPALASPSPRTPPADTSPSPSPNTPRPTATPRRPRLPSCSAQRNSEITPVPACLIYASALGTGWQVSGSGTNVTPGRPVPDGDQIAIRIQRRVKTRDQPATVTLLAGAPVTIGANTRLRLRIFGGRQYGTILRLSASPTAGRAGAMTVTLQAPPERWASFVVHVGALSPARLRRIDLAIASEQLPQAYEFYVDDLTLGK